MGGNLRVLLHNQIAEVDENLMVKDIISPFGCWTSLSTQIPDHVINSIIGTPFALGTSSQDGLIWDFTPNVLYKLSLLLLVSY
jgi:hypothetical protein